MAKTRLTPAQTRLLAWATSPSLAIGGQIVCPSGLEAGYRQTLDGRDSLGRLRVLHAKSTARRLVELGLLREVQGERDVFEVLPVEKQAR